MRLAKHASPYLDFTSPDPFAPAEVRQLQKLDNLDISITATPRTMSQFRAKKLDIAGFINPRVVRDHTKRKVFEQYEPDRYDPAIILNLR